MKAALLQLNVGDDPAANLEQTKALLRAAVKAGAQFVLTPEVTNCISMNRDHQRSVLQDESSDITLAGLRAEAAALGIWLLIGSLAVKTDDADGRFANRQFLIGPDGGIRARYDKIHMFDVQIGDGETYRESAGYRPGTRAVVADMPGFRLGMATCYDMRFGHLSRALVQSGSQVLVYPSAFSPVTGAAHWHSLLRARAIESGAWVLAPAQTGTHPATSGQRRTTFGHSLVVDPWGDVIVDAGTEPGFSVFDLDIDRVTDARRRIPALENAREFDGP
ncbi:carbon-nitrogen hydrolase family protein [Pseudosulfitobacter sp. DSM 107133]|uniref:carbon-nitrogen hydrolase family protein n=1 Tax=Pseudosulfitobacter sp. DSM 107133 TaxID=2883100 RepID=UPI000DF3DF32|nr:carbon-nitrogen hydrolase family protein [Pseudosulfitobacter sp. DSM 107133]UOA25454.1 Deaminated glutathione amidase [Pseudosulfitobacter sp. DSM 107133]